MKKNFYLSVSTFFFILCLGYLVLGLMCLKNNLFFLIKFSLNSHLNFMDLNMFILLDWISTLFMFTVFLISSMVMMYSYSYMLNDKKNLKFLILLVLFVLSMNMLVICPNLIISILGWDGLGLISFCLIIFYNNENSNFSGILTVMTNRLGDIGLILSIIFMVNFYSWNSMNFLYEKKMIYFVVFFLLLAATTKSAQLPFSAWLPAAMAAPTPVSSLVHSSTLVTAGIYLIIRFHLFFSNGIFSETLMLTSIITMFLAGVSALFETDMKKIIALSTLSQLGVMMMILSTSNFELALFHLLTHAIFKSTLFLCAGAIIHSSLNWQDIRQISLIFKLSPSISFSLMITNLSLMGFPFLSGFYSKDLILEMMYSYNNSLLMLTLIILSTMLTSLYSLRMAYFIFKNENMMSSSNFHDSKFINTPILLLSSLVIFLGNFLSWMSFSSPIFFFFNLSNKLINLIILVSGVCLFWFVFSCKNLNLFLLKNYSFFGKMWFSENTSLIMTFFLKPSKFLFKTSESWIENMSSKILSKEMNFLNFYFINFFYSNLNHFLKISFILLMMVIFLY